MPKYLVALVGEGNGCDYTIACNNRNFFFDAENSEQAKALFIAHIREEYSGFDSMHDNYGMFAITIYEVRETSAISMQALIDEEVTQERLQAQREREEEEREREEEERELYQKLKQKYA